MHSEDNFWGIPVSLLSTALICGKPVDTVDNFPFSSYSVLNQSTYRKDFL